VLKTWILTILHLAITKINQYQEANMALEQIFQDQIAETTFDQRDISYEKWNTIDLDKFEENSSEGFECNICLDVVHDPVVTLCGHLYCWPCIYKWIHFKTISSENIDNQ
ncbi:hypothetical protein AABB24_020871, partial [Solanum stoloniferum]